MEPRQVRPAGALCGEGGGIGGRRPGFSAHFQARAAQPFRHGRIGGDRAQVLGDALTQLEERGPRREKADRRLDRQLRMSRFRDGRDLGAAAARSGVLTASSRTLPSRARAAPAPAA
ncbi:hypothetical protein ACFQU2_14485 [Siccirubricoccus deserti]